MNVAGKKKSQSREVFFVAGVFYGWRLSIFRPEAFDVTETQGLFGEELLSLDPEPSSTREHSDRRSPPKRMEMSAQERCAEFDDEMVRRLSLENPTDLRRFFNCIVVVDAQTQLNRAIDQRLVALELFVCGDGACMQSFERGL